jgi:hypothetical protein
MPNLILDRLDVIPLLKIVGSTINDIVAMWNLIEHFIWHIEIVAIFPIRVESTDSIVLLS